MGEEYYEMGLPEYLQHDIDAWKKGIKENSSVIDCLWGELYGSINSAFWDGEITEEQANYLRSKYLQLMAFSNINFICEKRLQRVIYDT